MGNNGVIRTMHTIGRATADRTVFLLPIFGNLISRKNVNKKEQNVCLPWHQLRVFLFLFSKPLEVFDLDQYF